MQKKVWGLLGGAGAGILNGLLGAGGGTVVVPLLAALGVRETDAHATALSVIVPLSALSAGVFLLTGRVTLTEALPFLPGSLLGALLGSLLLPRLAVGWLKVLFGCLLLWGGVRLL